MIIKFYINKLTNKPNFKNIPELKMVQKNVLIIINLTIETINRFPTRQNYVSKTSWGRSQKTSYGHPFMVLYVTPRDVSYWRPEDVLYRRS